MVSFQQSANLDFSSKISHFLKKPEGQAFQFIGPDLSEVKYFGEGAGIAIRKEDTDLVEMFNQAIVKIRQDGTYKKIQDKYFDFNVYGE